MNLQQTSLTARQKHNHNQKTQNEFGSANGIKSNLAEHTYQENKRNLETSIHHKREKQKHYEMKLIEIKKRKLELKRKTFDNEVVKKKEIKCKESQNEKVKHNICTLNSEINEIVKELKTHKEKEIILITRNKEKHLNKINEKIFELKEIRRQIRKRKENEKEKRENEIMLEEEISQTKKQLLNSTSKMESHIELMLNLEQGSRKICQLMLTPKSNTEFVNDISINQYNMLDKVKLWSLIFEKIKIFNENILKIEKNSFSVNDSQDELSFSDLNRKESFQEEKENFVKRMMSIEAGENSNTQSKSSQTKRSSKNEKFYYDFNELIQLFLKEILSENEIHIKNSQNESDLKIIILSHIKLFIYENSITSNMSHLNSLKQNCDRTISNHNNEIRELYAKIKKKIKKIKFCKEKLKFITNEEKSLNQEGEMNLLNIKSMENDIEAMSKLQIQNEIELEIMKNELRSTRDRHEDKSSYYKIKKKKLKEKIKKLQESIEEKMNKIDSGLEVNNNKIDRNIDRASENYLDYNVVEQVGNYNNDYDQHSANLPSNKSGKYNSGMKVYQDYPDYSDYSRTFSGKDRAFSLTANFNSTPENNITRDKSADDTGNVNNMKEDKQKKFYSYTNSNFYPGRNPNQAHHNNFGINHNFNADINKNKLGFDLYYDNDSKQRGKNELSFLDKIRPLLLGNTVYKRYFVNINKKQTAENSSFNPVDFINGKINSPEDSNFLKSFLCINKSISKLLFNKLKEDDKSFEINLTSISKIVVPKITKDVIFLKQIYKKINMKKNKISDTNSYIEKNLGILVQMYHSGIKSELAEIDEKLFDEEYRGLLLKSNKYMLYIYLKPDEETRIELIFNDYEDFKHWINGMENILKNKEVKDFIKKRI